MKNVQVLDKSKVEAVVAAIPKTAIFTAEFVKKDNTLRKMNCRTGVVNHLTPNPKREKPVMPKNMLTVYDLQVKGYRHINLETVTKIVAEGTTFIFA